MDELIEKMDEILNELKLVNEKLDNIMGHGIDSSITDICSKLDSIDDDINRK